MTEADQIARDAALLGGSDMKLLDEILAYDEPARGSLIDTIRRLELPLSRKRLIITREECAAYEEEEKMQRSHDRSI